MELFLSEINWEGDPFEHVDDIYEYFAEKRLEDENKYEEWKNNLNTKLDVMPNVEFFHKSLHSSYTLVICETGAKKGSPP